MTFVLFGWKVRFDKLIKRELLETAHYTVEIETTD